MKEKENLDKIRVYLSKKLGSTDILAPPITTCHAYNHNSILEEKKNITLINLIQWDHTIYKICFKSL